MRKIKQILTATAAVSALTVVMSAAVSAEDVSVSANAAVPYSCPYVYEKITAMEEQYPSGTPFDNDDVYRWNGGYYTHGAGCAAFAFMLSDEAFGTLPAKMTTTFDADSVRVGDILRADSHSFIVVEVLESSFVVAEANVNAAVLWRREVSFDYLASAGFEHCLSRYPDVFSFAEESLSLDSGASAEINVISRDAASPVWSSSNTAVASVNANGVVTAHSGGEAVITASYGGVTDSVTVTVTGTGSDVPSYNKSIGDVTLDGAVDLSDASSVLSVYAKQAAGISVNEYTDVQRENADVDENGIIEISDASAILAYYAQGAAGLNPQWSEILA